MYYIIATRKLAHQTIHEILLDRKVKKLAFEMKEAEGLFFYIQEIMAAVWNRFSMLLSGSLRKRRGNKREKSSQFLVGDRTMVE